MIEFRFTPREAVRRVVLHGEAEGDVPAGIVQGVLAEEDRCLFAVANGRRTLGVWEAGLGFEDNALLDPAGRPNCQRGETMTDGVLEVSASFPRPSWPKETE